MFETFTVFWQIPNLGSLLTCKKWFPVFSRMPVIWILNLNGNSELIIDAIMIYTRYILRGFSKSLNDLTLFHQIFKQKLILNVHMFYKWNKLPKYGFSRTYRVVFGPHKQNRTQNALNYNYVNMNMILSAYNHIRL